MRGTRLGVGFVAAALLVTACGKIDNTAPLPTLQFDAVLPEKPVELSQARYTPWVSSRAIATRGHDLIVVDSDNGTLVVMDQGTLSVSATIPVGERPEHVLVGPDLNAWVTVRGAGKIHKVAPDNRIVATASVGSEPFAMALRQGSSPRLFVTLSGEHTVASLNPETLAVSEKVEVLDTPRSIVLANSRLFIVHQRSETLTLPLSSTGAFARDDRFNITGETSASLRRGIPSDHATRGRDLENSRPSRALAATFNPRNGGVLVAHVAAHPGTDQDFLDAVIREPGTSSQDQATTGYGSVADGGARATAPVRPIELAVTPLNSLGQTAQLFADRPVRDPLTGEPMTHLIEQPSDINHHPTHSLALVTGYGSDRVLVLNTRRSDPMLSPLGVVAVGWAPKAVTFSNDGARAFVLNHQEFSVSEIDLRGFFDMPSTVSPPEAFENGVDGDFMMPPMPARPERSEDASSETAVTFDERSDTTTPINIGPSRTASYGPDPRPAAIKRGQRVFTHARNGNMSHAGQFACATCHFEGREDKLVWVIDDGPRQTPSLAGRLHDTAPFNWAGSKTELKGNMVQTVTRMGGLGLNAQELDDLEAFLLSLQEVPNPHKATDGQLTDIQKWGQEIFNRADVGCASCHSGPAFTDGRNHDVGTATDIETMAWEFRRDFGLTTAASPAELNTPSLRGLFYTGPYLHDGSAETLHDVLDLAPEMGNPKVLSPDEKDALVAYLLTL